MMLLAPSVSIPAPVPNAVDTSLVPGLRLPRIPGLPGPTTPGISIGDVLAPPSPGSAAAKLDMAVVKGAQLLRTPQGDAWARRMNEDGVTKIWIDLAKRQRAATGVVQGWLGTALLAGTLAANTAATFLAKNHYDRPRPFQVDPSIKPPFEHPKSGSYPSGHSSTAFAAARVIAVLEPSLAKEAYELATQVAVSRVYSGVHFPSDIVTGALLGTGIAETVLRLTGKR